MGKLVFGLILLIVALLVRYTVSAVTSGGTRGPALSAPSRVLTGALVLIGFGLILASAIVVIGPGSVGVRHAFGKVDPTPLNSGIRFVTPWSSVERYSTREEPFPESDSPEVIDALSNEQMGMKIDVALRWQIDPQEAPRIFTEIGNEYQIHSAVRNAIRNGVRDGMVRFSINDLGKRNLIASAMETVTIQSGLVNSERENRRLEEQARKAQQAQMYTPSQNVYNLQRRVAGVLPVRIDVPKAGKSYRFVRPLVLDEVTNVTFQYRTR